MVEIIDDDLERVQEGINRSAFERLLTAICEGHIDAVFASAASPDSSERPRPAHRDRVVWTCPSSQTTTEIHDPRHPNDLNLIPLEGFDQLRYYPAQLCAAQFARGRNALGRALPVPNAQRLSSIN
jgi:hypothetical protein